MPGLRCALLAFSILPLTPTAGECAEGAPQTPPPETALKPCKPRARLDGVRVLVRLLSRDRLLLGPLRRGSCGAQDGRGLPACSLTMYSAYQSGHVLL